MKTTNNVRTTNLKKMVAAGLTILTLSTYAQMATMPNLELDAKNQFALATVNKTPATTGFNTASFNAYLEPATEESLPIEPWMTNEKNFESAAINALEPDAEEELNIESWMLKEENFNEKEIKKAMNRKSDVVIIGSTFRYREVNIEEELKVETWMVNSKIWNR